MKASPGPFACSPPLDVVGLGVAGGEEVVCTYGLGRMGPRAPPTAQESPTGHSEQAAGPADKHCLTKLEAAEKHRYS